MPLVEIGYQQQTTVLVAAAGNPSPTILRNYGALFINATLPSTSVIAQGFIDRSLLYFSRATFKDVTTAEGVLMAGESVVLDPDSNWYVWAVPDTNINANLLMGYYDTDYGQVQQSNAEQVMDSGVYSQLTALYNQFKPQAFIPPSTIIPAGPLAQDLNTLTGVVGFGSETRVSSSSQSIATGVATDVRFDVVNWDEGGRIVAGTGNSEFNIGPGTYRCRCQVGFGNNSTGRRILQASVAYNGGAFAQIENTELFSFTGITGAASYVEQDFHVSVNQPSIIKWSAYQSSGGNLSLANGGYTFASITPVANAF